MSEESSKITFSALRKWNITMAVLHGIQGVLMIFLGLQLEFTRDIFTFYLSIGDMGPEIVQEKIFTFDNVGVWVAVFLLLSAVAHTIIATIGFGSYVRNLQKNFNPFRWFEYALSSSVMVVLIAVLFGVWSFWTLVVIFALNATMNLFGYSMELQNQTNKKIDWTNYIFGWFAGIVPWLVIGAYYFSFEPFEDIPDFVTAIFFVQLVLFMSFAFNMLLQYLKVGPWKDYLFGERAYQILSLVAKTLLAWLVFGGIFQPE